MYASVGKLTILNIDTATSQAFYNMVFGNEGVVCRNSWRKVFVVGEKVWRCCGDKNEQNPIIITV
jgi:hypothetical protein